MSRAIKPDAATGTGAVSREMRALIGEIVIGWSYLENTLQAALGSLLSLDWESTDLLCKQSRMPGTISLVGKLAAKKVPRDAARIREIIREIQAISVERERIAHDFWWKLLRGRGKTIRTPRKKTGGTLEDFGFWKGTPVSKSDLDSISSRIAGAHLRLLTFFSEYDLWKLSPLPSTRP